MRLARTIAIVLLAIAIAPSIAFADPLLPLSDQGEGAGLAVETTDKDVDGVNEGFLLAEGEDASDDSSDEVFAKSKELVEREDGEAESLLEGVVNDETSNAEGTIEAFVDRLYQLVLNRESDAKGLADQVEGILQHGAAQITFNFFASDEFLVRCMPNEDRVALIYSALFDRTPDEVGYDMWLGFLNAGRSDLDIVAGFAESDEFKSMCAKWGVSAGDASSLRDQIAARDENLNVTSFVKRLYAFVLEREPDIEGLRCQSDAIRAGVSASEIASNFFNSPEFQARDLSNDRKVEIAYGTLLDRSSDSAGRAYWVEGLDNQMTIAYIVSGFCNSPEFKEKCFVWGVNPGQLEVTLTRDLCREVTIAVNQVYVKALGRNGDGGGLDFWCGVCLDKGYLWTLSGLLQSNEAADALPTGEQMAATISELCLGDDATAIDAIAWASYFDKGGSPAALLAELSGSAALEAHCKEMGIAAGSLMYFDVSNSNELNSKISSIIQFETGLDPYACFLYVSNFQYYKRGYWPSYEGWMEDYALSFLNDGGGNCYGYAALYAYLARACGYDADVYQGTVINSRGGLSNHGWTEIYIGDETYVCDPELYWELEILCYMVSYENAPFAYIR